MLGAAHVVQEQREDQDDGHRGCDPHVAVDLGDFGRRIAVGADDGSVDVPAESLLDRDGRGLAAILGLLCEARIRGGFGKLGDDHTDPLALGLVPTDHAVAQGIGKHRIGVRRHARLGGCGRRLVERHGVALIASLLVDALQQRIDDVHGDALLVEGLLVRPAFQGRGSGRPFGLEIHDKRIPVAGGFLLDGMEARLEIHQLFFRQIEKGVLLEKAAILVVLDPLDLFPASEGLGESLLELTHAFDRGVLESHGEEIGGPQALLGSFEGLDGWRAGGQENAQIGADPDAGPHDAHEERDDSEEAHDLPRAAPADADIPFDQMSIQTRNVVEEFVHGWVSWRRRACAAQGLDAAWRAIQSRSMRGRMSLWLDEHQCRTIAPEGTTPPRK